MKRIVATLVSLLAFPVGVAAVTPNWDPLPLRPKLWRCVPEEWNGPARANDGRGNSPNTRGLRVDFGTYRNAHIPLGVDPVSLIDGVDI